MSNRCTKCNSSFDHIGILCYGCDSVFCSTDCGSPKHICCDPTEEIIPECVECIILDPDDKELLDLTLKKLNMNRDQIIKEYNEMIKR